MAWLLYILCAARDLSLRALHGLGLRTVCRRAVAQRRNSGARSGTRWALGAAGQNAESIDDRFLVFQPRRLVLHRLEAEENARLLGLVAIGHGLDEVAFQLPQLRDQRLPALVEGQRLAKASAWSAAVVAVQIRANRTC